MNRRDFAVAGALVGTALVWGSAFTAIKDVVRVYGPVDLAILRFVVACVGFAAILVVLRVRGVPVATFTIRQWALLLVLGAFGVGGYHVALNTGEQLLTETRSEDTAAILSGFLISTNSLFTVLLAPWVVGERLGSRRVLGVLVALVGAGILVLWGQGDLVDRDSLVGILVVLVAPLSWAVYTVIAKRFIRGFHPLVLTSWAMIAGTALLLPFATPSTVEGLGRLQAAHWGWILLLALGATVGGYVVWTLALQQWDASRVSTFVYLVPLFGVVAATLIEHERITLEIALGGALILAGVYAANSAARPARPEPAMAPASE